MKQDKTYEKEEKEKRKKKMDKKLDIIFAEDSKDLLENVRSHLEKEHLKPISLNIVKEHNNFCALIVGELIK